MLVAASALVWFCGRRLRQGRAGWILPLGMVAAFACITSGMRSRNCFMPGVSAAESLSKALRTSRSNGVPDRHSTSVREK